MRVWFRIAACVFVFALLVGSVPGAAQEIKYAVGQNVAPVYEGWERLPDGTVLMHFGYLNRNYEEELDIPIGTENFFEPGPPDRGQPTHFVTKPRRSMFVFSVKLPKDWDPKARLVWTVVVNGKTEKANGWMQPEWLIDDGVQQMNIGQLAAPDVNERPKVSGAQSLTAAVGVPTEVSVSVTDDGNPKPRQPRTPAQARSMAPQGVGIRWIQYRGPGTVTFDPAVREKTYGAPISMSTRATFSRPGEYVIRAIAADGTLLTNHDVTVRVSAASTSQVSR
jgi:hypothetical protein